VNSNRGTNATNTPDMTAINRKQHPTFTNNNNNNSSMNMLENSVILTGGGGDNNTNSVIPPPTRIAITRQTINNTKDKDRDSRDSFAPMRFKLDVPEGYYEQQKYYLQQQHSDSDDDNDQQQRRPMIPPLERRRTGLKSTTGGGNGKNNTANIISFKHEKPIIHDRPQSASILRNLSSHDTELKVHYRFTNYRRMGLSDEQQHWLETQEVNRKIKSDALAKQLTEAVQLKNAKKGGSGKDGKGGKGGDKGSGKEKGKEKEKKEKDSKSRPTTATTGINGGNPENICKYKTANEFMSTHFPTFDNDLQSLDDQTSSNLSQIAPMRIMQLMEIQEIVQSCQKYHVTTIKDTVLKKALLIPQDKPDSICLENLRKQESEGLMLNPMPVEYWRKYVVKKGKKSSGGKKKKK